MHQDAVADAARWIARTDVPEDRRLYMLLRYLGRYRARMVLNTLRRRGGDAVRSGPFAGMTLLDRAAEGCQAPKLLGCYEQELHGVVAQIVAARPRVIVNIGCAEGYYAVGLARLLPDAEVWAFDRDEAARTACTAMAEKNGVAATVRVAGDFAHADFARYPPGDTVVLCDIEGGEIELLDPARAPALRHLDVLVELHSRLEATFNVNLVSRFEPSHDIERFRAGARDAQAFPELADLEELDQFLAVWEFRKGSTPWLFMTARERRPAA
jgi:hypothetical protein